MHNIFVAAVHAAAQLSAQWRTFAFIEFVASRRGWGASEAFNSPVGLGAVHSVGHRDVCPGCGHRTDAHITFVAADV